MKIQLYRGLRRFKFIATSKRLKIGFALFLGILVLAEGIGYYLGGWQEPRNLVPEQKISASQLRADQLQTRNQNLRRKLVSGQPRNSYLVVDTARNRLQLKNGNNTILEAVISAGSGKVLKDPKSEKQWIFDTPRGGFQINSKLVTPVWKRPDWDFIEKGEAIPAKYQDRMELGALGEYALGFGGGYFIHGTLYTRLLGRNVTHGCIRLDDRNLKKLYEMVGLGTYVFIY